MTNASAPSEKKPPLETTDGNLMICSNLTLSTAGSLLYVVNDTDDSVGTRGSPIDDRVDGYRHTVPR
jgi:hypothetical protein